MRRVTIMIGDELEDQLESSLRRQDSAPSLAGVRKLIQ